MIALSGFKREPEWVHLESRTITYRTIPFGISGELADILFNEEVLFYRIQHEVLELGTKPRDIKVQIHTIPENLIIFDGRLNDYILQDMCIGYFPTCTASTANL